jgi:DNA topoisomerase-1
MLQLTDDIRISNRKMKSILKSPEKTATAIHLVYVLDNEPGISRVKNKDEFYYYFGKSKITETPVLERIKKLAIPPAWENVWICQAENGHLQATGTDIKKRKQYKYHGLWNSLRNQTKFYRLYEFGKAIPAIRKQIEHDLSLTGMPVEKVLATVVSLMQQTNIRIGNGVYEKLYGSFGLTTLKDKHVKIEGSEIQFAFKGKKGISHKIGIKNKRLAKIVKNCRDIPGKELFQYYDAEGNRKSIDSGMVNNYLKAISGQDFTAKDFRTWAGTVHAISAFKNICGSEVTTSSASTSEPLLETKTHIKKNIILMLDQVAENLGNTRTVCRKYYVHPVIIELYEKNALHPFLQQLDKSSRVLKKSDGGMNTDLSAEEKLLMSILG